MGRLIRCECCRRVSAVPLFAVMEPGGEATRQICTRCSTHVSLTEQGTVFVPAQCPDCLRPRLRVLQRGGGAIAGR